jgi:hypothetical protein
MAGEALKRIPIGKGKEDLTRPPKLLTGHCAPQHFPDHSQQWLPEAILELREES